MLSSNMLLLILLPLIGVTFSTPTPHLTSKRHAKKFSSRDNQKIREDLGSFWVR